MTRVEVSNIDRLIYDPMIIRILYLGCIVFFGLVGYIIPRFANDDHVNYDLHNTDSK